MSDQREWLPVRVEGNGCYVKRDDQYGYAKTLGIGPELLASCLAQLVGAAVPRAEEGRVEGSSDHFVVSHVWGLDDSYPLEPKYPETRGAYSKAELAALRAASGLLPFFAWVANTDHGDDTNLVVDVIDGRPRIRAIDFGFAFAWPTEDEVLPWAPPGLLIDIDRRQVEDS